MTAVGQSAGGHKVCGAASLVVLDIVGRYTVLIRAVGQSAGVVMNLVGPLRRVLKRQQISACTSLLSQTVDLSEGATAACAICTKVPWSTAPLAMWVA